MAYNIITGSHFISAQSLSASFTSAAFETKLQDNIGIQLNWTGTPTGTFAVQISADHVQDINGNVQVAGNWVNLPLSPTIAAAGSADSAYIDLNQMSAPYVRIVYTRGSGTGTLNGYIASKGV